MTVMNRTDHIIILGNCFKVSQTVAKIPCFATEMSPILTLSEKVIKNILLPKGTILLRMLTFCYLRTAT